MNHYNTPYSKAIDKLFSWLDNHECIAGALFGFLFVAILWLFS